MGHPLQGVLRQSLARLVRIVFCDRGPKLFIQSPARKCKTSLPIAIFTPEAFEPFAMIWATVILSNFLLSVLSSGDGAPTTHF